MKLAARICGIIAGVLLLYVLSVGPAFRACVRGDVTKEESRLLTYKKVYAPLIWLYENSAMANGALGWYVELWAYWPPGPKNL